MDHDLDLFVIGGGSGGVRAARVAAEHGARVAIAEEDRYGGTCVIRGCIPKKLFVYASQFAHAFEDARAYGWDAEGVRFDWKRLLAAKDAEIARLSRIYVGLLEKRGVEVLRGRARLAGPNAVEVNGRRYSARYILVATGSRPSKASIPGAEHAITSDEMFHLEQLPRRICIAGGGYIAVEFAGILRGLGCEVTLVHRREEVLRGFDGDVRKAITEGLARLGVDLRLEEEVAAAERTDAGALRLSLLGGGTVEVDHLLCAIGRVPHTRDLGLEEAGVALGENGAVRVDEYSRSSVPSIYAVGDCTDRINLTPVAIREGQAFADTVFGERPTPVDHDRVASAVFSDPPVGVVGMTEEDARSAARPIRIFRSSFRPLFHTLTGRNERVHMKVVVDAGDDRVLGVHLVGKDAPEIIQAAAIAVKLGATKADFDRTTAVHPTTAEELVLLRTVSA